MSKDILVPDIGDYTDVDVIEINVNVGDEVQEEDSLVTLETDKASMEIPAPFAGKITEILIKVGDKVSQGSLIFRVGSDESSKVANEVKEEKPIQEQKVEDLPQKEVKKEEPKKEEVLNIENTGNEKNASPSVRRLSRILGIDLSKVNATGRKGRVTKDDCHNYLKNIVSKVQSGNFSSGTGLDLLEDPKIDFSKFGEIEEQPLSRINKLSSKNLHRNWVKIPHVTFFDDADITDLEDFRKSKKKDTEKLGIKLTLLVFLIKASAKVLQEFPKFNSSLSSDGEKLIIKKYYNIGFAVDTPKGLIVPVIKDVDKKSIYEISKEFLDLVKRGREGKIKPNEMQGSCFTISSLGGLGTNSFTPIINMPEVAILGVSNSQIKPIYNGKDFEPRLMLPLCLSADHKVIDGALAAKFLTRFGKILQDIREILL